MTFSDLHQCTVTECFPTVRSSNFPFIEQQKCNKQYVQCVFALFNQLNFCWLSRAVFKYTTRYLTFCVPIILVRLCQKDSLFPYMAFLAFSSIVQYSVWEIWGEPHFTRTFTRHIIKTFPDVLTSVDWNSNAKSEISLTYFQNSSFSSVHLLFHKRVYSLVASKW